MRKLKAILDLFRAGQVVADPKKWKNRQIGVTAVTGFLVALINVASVMGFAVPVPPGVADAAALALISVVNIALTYTTSDKVGIKAKKA